MQSNKKCLYRNVSTRNAYEKTVMKLKKVVFRGAFRTYSNNYDEAFLRK